MNLNSYIGLMGHSFDVRQTPEGQVLAPAGASGSIWSSRTPTTC